MGDDHVNQKSISILAWLDGSTEQVASFLESIMHQTYQKFELIVTGCNITKEMLELLERYSSEDNRISVKEFQHIDYKILEEYICLVDTKQVYSSIALEEWLTHSTSDQIQGSDKEEVEVQIKERIFNKELVFDQKPIRRKLVNEILESFIPIIGRYEWKESGRSSYNEIHEFFQQPLFADFTIEDFSEQWLYQFYYVLRNIDDRTFLNLTNRKIIASLTSYPGRIATVHQVIETIVSQKRKADHILLWLADSQFPKKERQLPKELLGYVESGQLTIKWCEDLRSHKKYYFEQQEYPDDLLITLDDDLLYKEDLIDMLYLSYMMYPNCVSAMRAHLMAINEEREILPYEYWIKEFKEWLLKPSYQLFATSGAGTLYPPSCMHSFLFNKEAISETCRNADDLWLKAMQVLNDTPVVLAQDRYGIHYVPGTQVETLTNTNVLEDGNDIQLANISKWLDAKVNESNVLASRILQQEANRANVTASKELYRMYATEKQTNHERRKRLNETIERIKAEKKALSEKLQVTYDEKSEINRKLQLAYAEKSEINRKLQLTYAEKSEINSKLNKSYERNSELNATIKELVAQNEELKRINKKQKKYAKKYKRIERALWYRIGRKLCRPFSKIKAMFHK